MSLRNKRIAILNDSTKYGRLTIMQQPIVHTYSLGELYTERKEKGDPSLPILTVSIHTGVSEGELDEDKLGKKVKRITDKTQYKTARKGDLVFNMMRAWQGAIGVVRSDGLVSPAYIVAKPNEKIWPEYMDYCMKTPRMIHAIHRQSYGVTDFRLRLYWDSFTPITCQLPPLPEQQKIATILSTQDKVIELKEKLLAQKQQQKKYLMQQLLTGKKRLLGFNEKWKVEKFSEIFDFLSTNTLSRDNLFEGVGAIQNIHYGDILTKFDEVIDLDCVCLPSIKESAIPNNCATVKSGDIIIADTAEDLTAGKAVEVQNIGDRVIYSGLHTMLCRPKEQLFSDGWLGFYMNSEAYHKQLIPYIAGVKVMAISKSNIVKTYIAIPSKAEQAAIVEILSTADHEIDLLQKSIKAEKQKKKALMQLLLTGKVSVRI